MSWIQMKESALQYYFLYVLSKVRENCLTGDGVGGAERKDKGHSLTLPHPPAPTRDLAHLRTCIHYCVSTKENASYLCTVHEVVTVLYVRRFDGLDRPGTFCLDLMCSVFLTRELVSIL